MPSPDSCGLHDLYASLDSKLFSIACAFVYIHMCLYISIVPNKLCSGINNKHQIRFPMVVVLFQNMNSYISFCLCHIFSVN